MGKSYHGNLLRHKLAIVDNSDNARVQALGHLRAVVAVLSVFSADATFASYKRATQMQIGTAVDQVQGGQQSKSG